MKTKFNGILTLLLAFVVQLTFAQEKTISGTVVDETNMPLPGATVVIKGTTTGASTDFDGKYSISANAGDVLVFSYVGYAEQNATVAASNTIDISLVLDDSLEEVVVTAFGIKRKPDALTSSTKTVKAEVLTQASNPNVIQSLAGKVSGLKINTTSNGVNQTVSIVLRGNRSLTGSNQALIVIDGAISSANTLANLAPEVIESTNIIKGAGGSALYGSQGANGVIIVTTKSGTADSKLRVDVNSSLTFEEVAYVPQRQTKYGQGWNGGHVTYENGGWGPEFDGSLQPVGLAQADGSYIMAPYSPIKDNIKQFFGTGTVFQNGATISGGDATGNVLLSLNKQNTEFVVKGDELSRTNVLFKAGKQLGNLNVSGNVTYINTKTTQTSAALFNQLLQTATNVPVSAFENSGNEGHWTSYYRNPYWMRDNIRFDNKSNRLNGIVKLKYDLNDNITVMYNASLRTFNSHSISHTNGYVDTSGVGGGDHSTISQFDTSNSESSNIYTDLLVNFDYMLTDDLNFKSTVGHNIQDNQSSFTSVGGSNLTIPGFYNIDNITGTPRVNNSHARSRTMGLFASVDLGYKDYVYMTLTGRNDWTSRLAKGSNSFFYPSAGISFIPTKAFTGLKGDILTYAKVSANLSKVGNAGVGTYQINTTLNQASGFAFGNLNSFGLDTSIADPNLVNEFIISKEATLSLAFLKGDRITLEASIYQSDNKDLITNITTSTASGLASTLINIGETQTTGFEIDLGLVPLKFKDFRWDLNLSLSHDKTVVKKVSDSADEVALNGNNSIGIFATVGEEFPLIKGTGYQRDDQGRVIIDETTGNPLKTEEFIKLGVANPDYILGLNTSVTYKGFRLAGVFDYRTGHQFWSGTKDWLSWSGHLVESAENGRRGFIFPNSSIETSPGVYTANTNVTTGGSTYANYLDYFSNEYRDVSENFVLDATAFKVRELSLSYAFSDKMLKNVGITALRVGVNGRNLFTVLPGENRGYSDPEFSNTSGNAQGLSTSGRYPATRTYGMTVNLTF
ncbi:MAG: SusC/RagA family TonB-linked outer membrane protein [Flavobacteriaceae bacterium]|nr:SusC/RagA family TonB-linked outer membrane protein [Flavobacteriaceae bacterium]